MANDKVKVVGYAQRVFYNNGIEYRNFSDDLVGNQFASEADAPLFTIANFNITTNLEKRASRLFNQNRFTSFFCLEDLTTDNSINIDALVEANLGVKLKLDKTNLCNYAFFGSMVEFVRVSLENIIMKWPASLYVDKYGTDSSTTGFTIENYSYDILEQKSTFRVPVDSIVNKFNINYLNNGLTISLNTNTSDLKNMSVSYKSYVIDVDGGQFNVVGFTGATDTTNDYLYFEVNGNPFSSTTSTKMFHIRPNNDQVEFFFNTLPDFEAYILNRDTLPKYKTLFSFPERSDSGVIFYKDTELTWPVSDGYNIDFDSSKYTIYVSQLLDIATNFDNNKTDIVARQLVSESVSDFDTFPRCDGTEEISEGQKVNRTLRIYGREFDEIKRYIDGIKWTNRVTYDKKDNTPDAVLKYLARTMGWGMVSSILENDLLLNYLRPAESTYSGQTRGLTPYEAEIEMWRRLIINSPWIWKSKGTRKVVEFFLKFIGAPRDLIQFNEYVWVAKRPVDVELIKDVMEELGYDSTYTENLNFDSEGYPRALRNTPDMYFQKGGLWYRETGGVNAVVDITTGNNPHAGPYDAGKAYLDQFRCLIPDFSAVTITREVVSSEMQNIFTNYNSGLVNNTTDGLSYSIVNNDGVPIEGCFEIYGEIIEDPKPTTELTDCGCETGEGDNAIRFSIRKLEPETGTTDCGYSGFTFDDSGYIVFTLYNGKKSFAIPVECCEAIGQTPVMVDRAWWCSWNPTLCESYQDSAISTEGVVIWLGPNGQETTVVPSAECCDTKKGYVPQITKGGYRCILPCVGLTDIVIQNNGVVIWQTPQGTTTTTVEYAECCDRRPEYNAVALPTGGYQCVVKLNGDGLYKCSSYTPVAVQIDNIVIWENTDGNQTVDVDSATCCKANGFIAVPSLNVKGQYNCVLRNTGVPLPEGNPTTGTLTQATARR